MWLANYIDFFCLPASPGWKVWNHGYFENLSASWSRSLLIGARCNPYSKMKTRTKQSCSSEQECRKPIKDCPCPLRPVDALVNGTVKIGMWLWALTKKLPVRLCLCGNVGVPRPPPFPCFFFFFPPRIGGFVLLIPLECSSYQHLDEFIILLPSVPPRPRRLRNKRAIVLGAAPWIQVCWHPIFPIIKREGEKLIMLPSPREWKEKSLQEQRLRPPAIKSSYSKAKDWGKKKKKKKGSRFTRVFCSCVCTRPEKWSI